MTIRNIFRGFVRINVTGFSVERFINMATYRGALIWNVMKIPDGASMCVSIKGFRLIRDIGRKTSCKIRITGKSGMPFALFRYRKKKFLFLGVLGFVALVYFLASFVWLVEVVGNDRVETSAIMDYLERNGLHAGSFKNRVELLPIQEGLLKTFDDLSFAHINIKGTRCTVYISEIIPKKDIIDTDIPCNIVADRDAVIVSIATKSGTPKVKPGDIVKQGQMLVSGELSITAEGNEVGKDYVHSYADIRAKVYYEVTFSVPFCYQLSERTGKEKKDYGISFLGNNINLKKSSIFYTNYDRITENMQWRFGTDYPIPLSTIVTTYREYSLTEKTRTTEEAKSIALKQLDSRIIHELSDESEVSDKDLSFSEDIDNLYVRAVLTVIEAIGQEDEIKAQGAESANGRQTETEERTKG